MNSYREDRVKDFQRRAEFSPEAVYHHPSAGWQYIPVHHFADETDDPVWGVDCWCLLGSDAALLQCFQSGQFQSALYIRIDAEKPFWPKLHAVLAQRVTRKAAENAMQRFVELGFPDPITATLAPGDLPLRLE